MCCGDPAPLVTQYKRLLVPISQLDRPGIYRNEIKKKCFPKTKTHEINSHCKQKWAKEQKETQDEKVAGIVKQKQLREKNYKLQPCRKSRSYNELDFPWKYKLVRGTQQPTYLHRNKLNTFTGATKGYAGTSRNAEHSNSFCKAAAFLIRPVRTSSNPHNLVLGDTVLTWDTRRLPLCFEFTLRSCEGRFWTHHPQAHSRCKHIALFPWCLFYDL